MKNIYKSALTPIVIAFIFALSVSSVKAAYGLSAAGAPICGNTVPGTPSIKTLQSVGGGSVELTWDGVTNATAWTVAYGVSSGKYIYGVHNFGDSMSRGIKISELPGRTYYFALRANNGCMPGPFSTERVVTVGGGIAQTTIQPQTGTPQATPTPATVRPKTGQTPKATGTIQPKATPSIVTPAPTPQRTSWWLSIINFFKSLFGK